MISVRVATCPLELVFFTSTAASAVFDVTNPVLFFSPIVLVDLHKRMQWHLRLDDKFFFAFLVFSKAIDSSFDFDRIIPICAGDWLLLVGFRKGKTSSYPLLTKYICGWHFLEAIPKTGQDESKRYQVRSWLDGCDAKSYQRNAAWGRRDSELLMI